MELPPAEPRRNSLGDISVLYVTVMARAIEHHGHAYHALFEQFGLDSKHLQAPDARISIPRFMRLGQAAIALTGNRALGLTMGELTRPVDAGLAGVTASTAETAGAALETLIRFDLLNSYNSRGHPTLSADGQRAVFYSIRPYNIFNYFVVDSVLAGWVNMLRLITGQHEVVERVTIEYPSQALNPAFESWFGCPVDFAATQNSIVLAPGVTQLPALQSQPALFRKLRDACDRELAQRQAGWGLQEKIREKLAPLLEGEPPRLEEVAAELGIAPWTLQRQLASEGTGFRELMDETRKDLARAYVRETRLAFAEIAWLLGFSGPASFHKAFRRWSGISPGRYRRDNRPVPAVAG